LRLVNPNAIKEATSAVVGITVTQVREYRAYNPLFEDPYFRHFFNMKKQVVITGGLGFIGQHLVTRLIQEGFYPIIVDNLSTGRLETLKLFHKSKFTFIKCDITKKEKLKSSGNKLGIFAL